MASEDGASLDATNTRIDKRVTNATSEPRNGTETTRSGQLRAKGAPHNPSHGPCPEEERFDEPSPLPRQASRTVHPRCHRVRARTLSNHTRTCNKLPDVYMYT
jgi:hypothetical protein